MGPMTKAIVDLMIENSTAGMLNQKLLDPMVVNQSGSGLIGTM